MLRNSTRCKVRAVTTASQPRAARGRRATRPSGDDRELAILETAERLLEERPFADISVDDLAKGAGLSRPTFYFYFPSKDAVLLTLLDRVIAEADDSRRATARWTRRRPGRAFWRAASTCSSTPSARIAVMARAAHGRQCDQRRDARELWADFMQKWIDSTTAVIEAERDRGAAPDDHARPRPGDLAQPDERAR